ncbi:amidohydrolase family protein [Acuticoccus sp. M5D2P5]|uniref:amidohydrolase family protein n=1 Tax=Acuticoccus kalidii TaxID=2910977 RepID=UPI001F1F61F6|nr:amidohydrolase family protein [Acuticoccus kalidii]MCF3932652.1 amidohydrolase family protein [Acuticoccus kalidii]
MANPSRLIVRSGLVLNPGDGVAKPHDILVIDGRIAEVGPHGMEAPPDAAVIDASDRIVHPGLVNAHTHGHGHYSRGVTDDVTLELLLAAGPWLTGQRSREDKYLSTAIGAAEMVLKGCTACYDMFLELPVPTLDGLTAAAQAYSDVGMRAVLAPMVADHPFFHAIPGLYDALPDNLRREVDALTSPDGEVVLKRIKEIARSWPFAQDDIPLAMGPTVPLLCTDAFMNGCVALAREHGMMIQTHLSESKVQEVAAQRRYGMSLTEHLARLGVLGPDLSAAHGVWLSDGDMMRLADEGVSVVLNVASNMRLGSGLPQMRRLLDEGVNVAVGTDSSSCCDNQNMYEATRLAAYTSHLFSNDYRQWVTSREAAHAATEGSARALGMPNIGRIDRGYYADLVFLDLGAVHYLPLRNVLNQVVQAEDSTAVRDVMINGRWVVRDRKLLTLDIGRLRPRVGEAIARLDALTATHRAIFRQMQPIVGSYCAGLSATRHHVHRFAGIAPTT